ncbi:MAG: Gfo/Idh/MocA family oxidoreductase [Planctomycetes bacterium]|nr:Gfo/Idh/MocA family oxidoreductase [Planctomycetota bacterium]
MAGNKSINRRQFIKKAVGTTAGVIGFPYIVRSSALGKDGAVAPSNRIALGCIGMGGQGTGNMRGFLTKDKIQVVAVCDVDERHLKRALKLVKDKYGNNDCAGYKDFREIIERRDIDAVSIALPDPWHAIPAIMACRVGKDIYSEKPLAYTISEGRAICDAVKRYGVVWQTGSWQRSVSHFRLACELVRNGRIGEVKLAKVGLPYGNGISGVDWTGGRLGTELVKVPDGFDYDMWLGPSPFKPYAHGRCHWNWRWISDYSGGQITDWAGHHIDIAHWGMNADRLSPVEIKNPSAVFPNGKEGLYDTPMGYYFECNYAEGFRIIVADARQNTMGVRFEGSEGWIHVNRGGIDAHPKSILKSAIKPNEIHLYESNDHTQNFIDCIASRAETITPAETAHHSIMVGHLGTAAIKLGRDLKWDPASERFINDEDANRLLSRPMRRPWHL